MADIFESPHKKTRSSYRYAPINIHPDLEDSSGFESSEANPSSSELPVMDHEDDDCLPPVASYGTFSRKNSRKRTLLSKLPDGDVPPYRAVFLVTNAAFGAGILNFPQAYMNAGGLEVAITVQCVRYLPCCCTCFLVRQKSG